jgi:integrase
MQMRFYIGPKLGTMPLNRVQPAHVRQFVVQLEADGLHPPTINSTLRLLRRLFSAAVHDRRIALNPVSGIQAPRPVHREMRILTPQEVEAIANAVDPCYRALVLFLAYTGVRVGEASAVRVGDLDLKGERNAHGHREQFG